MAEIISSPVFGVVLSLAAYIIGCFLKDKLRLAIFNPLLIGIILVIAFLKIFNISYEDYNNGGAVISFFLAPATIALALPLYKKWSLFKENMIPILGGVIAGVIASIGSVIGLCKLFGLSEELTASLVPKSITTPIAMSLAEQMGGISSITVAAVILTGIFGAIICPILQKATKFNDKVAMGIAMGNCAHAVGTSKAMELGETEGAMSGLTIALAGVITVLIAPLLWRLLG